MSQQPWIAVRLWSAARWLRSRPRGAAAWLVVAVFLVMVARFRHPCYGFTRFLRFDAGSAVVAVREISEAPIYVDGDDAGGYDGLFHAELAYHPLLDSPELPAAIDNLSYRARRILGSALAWLCAGGNPQHIGNVYASLNIVVWLALAVLLWRLLPVRDWHTWFAWAGLHFSAGALHSVRPALTDLLALTGIALAMLFAERGRNSMSVGVLATAALARETSVLATIGVWRDAWRSLRDWARSMSR